MDANLNFRFLTEDVTIPLRRFLAVTILTSSTFAWFFLLYIFFDSIFLSLTGDLFAVHVGKALFLSFSAFSAIIGSLISEKVNRRKLLWAWITLGVLASASLAVFQGSTFVLFSSLLLGVSFGLGIPSCLAFLADSTVVEERARVSGIIIIITFFMVIAASFVASLLNFGLIWIVSLCLVRLISFPALFLDSCSRATGRKKSWRRILAYKDFSFYLFPWLMFNIASGLYLGIPDSPDYATAISIGNALHYVGAGIFAFLSGIVADRLGRKSVIIFGLVMLGVSFAFLGLATSALSYFVYRLASGIAWGCLMAVYLAVPGDLAFPGSKERFYALAAILTLNYVQSFSIMSDVTGISFPPGTLSPALSIILFLSTIPVLYASETLPENKVHARKLNEYLRKMGKRVAESKKPDSSSL